MVRNLATPSDGLEEILDWLNPDREVAATMFVQLQHDIARIVKWRGCADPEGLTDEVFDRVARKVHELRQTFAGDPRLYFHAVANNLVKEDFKRSKRHVSLEEIDSDLPQQIVANDDQAAEIEECLDSCLEELSSDKRELILEYYAREKQAKIDYRHELAQQLGISVETLRVRVYRIRLSIEECIDRCRKEKSR